jgi:hypothetical protein
VSDGIFVVGNENSSQLKHSFLLNFWVSLGPNKNIVWLQKREMNIPFFFFLK